MKAQPRCFSWSRSPVHLSSPARIPHYDTLLRQTIPNPDSATVLKTMLASLQTASCENACGTFLWTVEPCSSSTISYVLNMLLDTQYNLRHIRLTLDQSASNSLSLETCIPWTCKTPETASRTSDSCVGFLEARRHSLQGYASQAHTKTPSLITPLTATTSAVRL